MAEVVRFSVSLETDLLEKFDRFCEANRFATRSEAVRQLLRDSITSEAWDADAPDSAATLTLVYDHHRTQLLEQLLEIQHRHAGVVVATTHVHLDHDLCMEVIFLRGQTQVLRDIAAQLRGLKGIHKGQLVVANARAAGAGAVGGHDHAEGHQHAEDGEQ